MLPLGMVEAVHVTLGRQLLLTISSLISSASRASLTFSCPYTDPWKWRRGQCGAVQPCSQPGCGGRSRPSWFCWGEECWGSHGVVCVVVSRGMQTGTNKLGLNVAGLKRRVLSADENIS